MPELPEVETVRRGLEAHVTGRTIARAVVLHPRAVRRHAAGGEDLARRLIGRTLLAPCRRGKYLWIPLAGSSQDRQDPLDEVLVLHLGMSGQLLVGGVDHDVAGNKHLRASFEFTDGGPRLRFVDQRTFGGMMLDQWAQSGDVPAALAHIARDPLDPLFDAVEFIARLRSRRTEVKRAILDQTLISGIGNIYADESLWRARLHSRRSAASLSLMEAEALLAAVVEVLGAALISGGTSFDALYVDVNGQSGYFDRSLEAYGQEGRPCSRCGATIVRVAFTNRSSFFCPVCQCAPEAKEADQ